LRIDDAGLDDDAGVGQVDREGAVEPDEADDDAALGREGATAEARAGAAGNEGDALLVAEADELLDLCGGGGQDDGGGDDAEIGEAIALVGAEFLGGGKDGVGADEGAEGMEKGGGRGQASLRAGLSSAQS
jgi:hypothetical protein